jgi:hypothetical protein
MFEFIKPILEESLNTKKGITLHINGSTVVGYVTQILEDKVVQLRNRERDKILVFIERIDAVEI